MQLLVGINGECKNGLNTKLIITFKIVYTYICMLYIHIMFIYLFKS